jgi:hypothetical protein
MKVNKIDKPGKVYVVTRKTKAGSMGTSSGAKVRDILRRVVCCRLFVCVSSGSGGTYARCCSVAVFLNVHDVFHLRICFQGGKLKFVDRRLRNDTRALKRKEKRGPKRK